MNSGSETVQPPLPPSSLVVLRVLGDRGPMTHREIVAECRCSPRTVRYALKRLRECNMVMGKMDFRDMRMIIYQSRQNQG